MPNFSPNSIIRIGRVPFDNSYRHTMTFASASSQTTYFTSVCTQALSQSDYTYVRMNNSIRVPFNAESLYTYNYVMYQNKNYGTKWFYAFIVGVNYVNENMTELVLELDVMQTWYFDYTLKECFVEREHVNDDTWGIHLNPEPAMELEYIYDNFVEEHTIGAYIVLLVNQYPNWNISQTEVMGSTPISGGKYQNQYNACVPIIYKGWLQTGIDAFKEDMEAFNGCGAAQTICDAFTVPSWSIDANDLIQLTVQSGSNTITRPYTFTLKDGTKPGVYYSSFSRPTSVNGYVPKNNKVLTYPYCFLELGDFSGRKQDYRWEFFDYAPNDLRVNLENRGCGISDCVGYVTPMNYNGIDSDTTSYNADNWNAEPFTYDFSNKISWVFSTYQTWAAQNAVANQLAVIGSIGAMSFGAAAGVSSAAKTLGAGSQMLLPGMERYASNSSVTSTLAQNARGQAIFGGAMGLGSTIANIEKMKRTPNTASGNTAGNSKFQNNYSGWYYAYKSIRAEFAEIVDDFFSMFGYEVDVVKIPNREGRAKWNYVKTGNACFYGNVPADMMAKINSIYDSGITFWHTSDIGNYSAANTIVI